MEIRNGAHSAGRNGKSQQAIVPLGESTLCSSLCDTKAQKRCSLGDIERRNENVREKTAMMNVDI